MKKSQRHLARSEEPRLAVLNKRFKTERDIFRVMNLERAAGERRRSHCSRALNEDLLEDLAEHQESSSLPYFGGLHGSQAYEEIRKSVN